MASIGTLGPLLRPEISEDSLREAQIKQFAEATPPE